jgi:hypothetical protein
MSIQTATTQAALDDTDLQRCDEQVTAPAAGKGGPDNRRAVAVKPRQLAGRRLLVSVGVECGEFSGHGVQLGW